MGETACAHWQGMRCENESVQSARTWISPCPAVWAERVRPWPTLRHTAPPRERRSSQNYVALKCRRRVGPIALLESFGPMARSLLLSCRTSELLAVTRKFTTLSTCTRCCSACICCLKRGRPLCMLLVQCAQAQLVQPQARVSWNELVALTDAAIVTIRPPWKDGHRAPQPTRVHVCCVANRNPSHYMLRQVPRALCHALRELPAMQQHGCCMHKPSLGKRPSVELARRIRKKPPSRVRLRQTQLFRVHGCRC